MVDNTKDTPPTEPPAEPLPPPLSGVPEPPEEPRIVVPIEKRGLKRKQMILITTVVVLLSLVVAVVVKINKREMAGEQPQSEVAGHKHEDDIDYWTCSMHPFVKQDGAGKCPVCGMDLTPVKKQTAQPEQTADNDEIDYWTCSMHPFVKQNGPGKCPVCGMDLIPVKKGTTASGQETGSTSDEGATFTIAPERQQLIGVRLTEVQPQIVERTIRAVGTVAVDETKIVHVQQRFSGWIEQVYANETWQVVKRGQPLFSVYSPELLATQQEYLLARRGMKNMAESPFLKVSGMESLAAAARRRLALFGISETEIKELEETGKAQRALTIYSPATGNITEKNAFPNMQVTPETKIYTISDHRNIWVWVDVYENDIAQIKTGMAAKLSVAAYPGKPFWGKVTFIAPQLNPQTRTLRVRLEYFNPDLVLKPEMYGDVEMLARLGTRLMIPESAVIRTGKRNIAFVSLGEGRFAVRDVELGMKFDGKYEVLSGVTAGEQIVTAANFLVDAESKLQGITSSWGESTTPQSQPAQQPMQHQH
jgi:membrane fusion protein, copper/silver efflux system